MSSEGELFLGFNGAINSINTGNIAFNKKSPVVFVSQLSIRGQLRNFDSNNKITIRPGERSIVIEFSATEF